MANFVTVLPPSIQSLESRLTGRGTETAEKINERVNNARDELRIINETPDIFKFRIINDDLNLSREVLLKLVQSLY